MSEERTLDERVDDLERLLVNTTDEDLTGLLPGSFTSSVILPPTDPRFVVELRAIRSGSDRLTLQLLTRGGSSYIVWQHVVALKPSRPRR